MSWHHDPMPVTDKPRLKPHRWRWDSEEGRHIAVVVTKAKAITFLSPSAAIIFSACDGMKTIVELAGLLVESYGISVEQATADTLAILGLWRELNMSEA